MNTTKRDKRKRTFNACTSCRQAKARCEPGVKSENDEQTSSCHRCETLSLNCVFPSRSNTRRRKKKWEIKRQETEEEKRKSELSSFTPSSNSQNQNLSRLDSFSSGSLSIDQPLLQNHHQQQQQQEIFSTTKLTANPILQQPFNSSQLTVSGIFETYFTNPSSIPPVHSLQQIDTVLNEPLIDDAIASIDTSETMLRETTETNTFSSTLNTATDEGVDSGNVNTIFNQSKELRNLLQKQYEDEFQLIFQNVYLAHVPCLAPIFDLTSQHKITFITTADRHEEFLLATMYLIALPHFQDSTIRKMFYSPLRIFVDRLMTKFIKSIEEKPNYIVGSISTIAIYLATRFILFPIDYKRFQLNFWEPNTEPDGLLQYSTDLDLKRIIRSIRRSSTRAKDDQTIERLLISVNHLRKADTPKEGREIESQQLFSQRVDMELFIIGKTLASRALLWSSIVELEKRRESLVVNHTKQKLSESLAMERSSRASLALHTYLHVAREHIDQSIRMKLIWIICSLDICEEDEYFRRRKQDELKMDMLQLRNKSNALLHSLFLPDSSSNKPIESLTLYDKSKMEFFRTLMAFTMNVNRHCMYLEQVSKMFIDTIMTHEKDDQDTISIAVDRNKLLNAIQEIRLSSQTILVDLITLFKHQSTLSQTVLLTGSLQSTQFVMQIVYCLFLPFQLQRLIDQISFQNSLSFKGISKQLFCIDSTFLQNIQQFLHISKQTVPGRTMKNQTPISPSIPSDHNLQNSKFNPITPLWKTIQSRLEDLLKSYI